PRLVKEKKEEDDGEKKKHSLLEKLHRSDSSSSSSSDEEEVGEDGEKRKRKKEKKGLKEKIQGKVDDKEEKKHEDTAVPVEKVEVDPAHPDQEKKGFLDKIKEKLPGHKKTEEVPLTSSD
ncbi:hypothetical protein EI013_27860, partial [Escherichia coli]|nr:hypothetical protein [Escherichia coli]